MKNVVVGAIMIANVVAVATKTDANAHQNAPANITKKSRKIKNHRLRWFLIYF